MQSLTNFYKDKHSKSVNCIEIDMKRKEENDEGTCIRIRSLVLGSENGKLCVRRSQVWKWVWIRDRIGFGAVDNDERQEDHILL